MPCLAPNPLAQVIEEARRGTDLVRQLVDLLAAEAPSRDSRALAKAMHELDAVALEARLLALEARIAGLLHDRAGLGLAANELAALADHCGRALRVLGLLRRSVEQLEAQRGAKLERRTSLMPPPASLPSTIS